MAWTLANVSFIVFVTKCWHFVKFCGIVVFFFLFFFRENLAFQQDYILHIFQQQNSTVKTCATLSTCGNTGHG